MNKEIFQGQIPGGVQPRREGVGLTTFTQNLYSGERNSVEGPNQARQGGIFSMAEDQAEIQKPRITNKQEVPQKAINPEHQAAIEAIQELMGLTGGKAPAGFQEKIEGRMTGGERQTRTDVVGRVQDERLSKDVEVRGQVGGAGDREEGGPRISLEDISSDELKRRLDYLNKLPDERFLRPEFLESEHSAIHEAMVKGAIPPAEAAKAMTSLDHYIARLAEERARLEQERLREQEHLQGRAQRGAPEQYFPSEDYTAIKNGEFKDPKTGKITTREEIFEGLFARADATPGREFNDAFSFYYDEPVYRAFIDILRKAGKEKEVTQYVTEREIRETLHNTNFVMIAQKPTEILVNYLQNFRSEMADMAFRKKGVTVAFHMYEQAIQKVMQEHGGYLPYEAVAWDPRSGAGTSEVESLTLKYLQKAIEKGLVKDENGRPVEEMADWEKKRALSIARGMGIVTMRTLELAASSKLPPNRYASLYGQDIIRDIRPFTHIIGKFGIGKERLAVLGFKTGKGGFAWSQQELLKFAEDAGKDMHKVLAAGDRYISYGNPYETANFFSGWRVGEEETSATANLTGADREWAGTGVWIEKLRGDLTEKAKTEAVPQEIVDAYPETERDAAGNPKYANKYDRAKDMITRQLKRIAAIQPLRLYNNFEEVKESVNQGIGLTPEDRSSVIDELVILQEKAVQEKSTELAFESIRDPLLQGRVRKFAEKVGEKWGSGLQAEFIKNLEDKKFKAPFILGTEDVPFDKYDFINTGGTTIARKYRDFGAESKAVNSTIGLLRKMDSYKKQEDIIHDLREIYENISQYDEDTARRAIGQLAEGVMKFYGKDWWARLPLGAGTLLGSLAGHELLKIPGIKQLVTPIPGLNKLIDMKASYAKTKFGNLALGWDESNKWKFTRLLEDSGMLTYEQITKLRKRTGATLGHYAMDQIRTWWALGLFAIIAEFLNVSSKDIDKL